MATAKGSIQFEHVGIGTALKRNRLMVPVNQRDYSWEERHVLALFHDIANAISSNKSAYFLGTIVLTAAGKGDAVEVADGQQRLATSTILLAAIRDYLHSQGKEMLVNSIETDFLFTIVRETESREPRLTLNVNDREFFEKRILPRPGEPDRQCEVRKESHERITAAAKLAAEHVKHIVSAHSAPGRIDVLNKWTGFLEDAAQVIVLRVPDDLNAFVMFETLNDRGIRTSQSDLLKNYLFGEADDRLAEAQQKWASMIGALESAFPIDDILLTYLRHLAISLHGYMVERDVYERIKERVSGTVQAIAFLDSLEGCAKDYVAISTSSAPKWNSYPPGIRKSIDVMNELRAGPLKSLMLAIARKFSPKEAEKAFRIFVRCTVRLLIVGGGRSGSVEQTYAECAKNVTLGALTSAKALLGEMRSVIPTDAVFESAFATAKVSQAYLARYYLRALELRRKGVDDPEWIPNDQNVINLEHVLPESPGTNWPDIDSETAAANYKRIGNLVLLQATKNTLIGNKAFSEKVAVLKQSTYLTTKDVAKETEWGIDQINSRQKALAKLAVETWSIKL